MVADGEGGGEDAEDEERLSGPLVLDVFGDGVLDEGELCEHLRKDEAEGNSRYQVVLAKAQVYSKTQQPGPKCPSTTDVAPAAPETQSLQLATKSKTLRPMQCRPVTALT